ncbi:unnamed protein product [Choristocarpus tenellus]
MSLQADQGAEPHALIGVSPDQTFFKKIDIAAVGNEIQALTSKLAGDGGAISEKPIYLKVMQKSGPTLTLIDLPGIMHNSANEGQTDILSATVSLVSKFVKNTEMVILMVVQAMDKFANAEVIKIAKEYDPDGNRTLGVVTKIDHIQPGMVPPLNEVRRKEAEFFRTNNEVAGLEKEYWGMETLVDRIVEIQTERISEFIPQYTKMAKARITELKGELKVMPPTFQANKQRWVALHNDCTTVRDMLGT